MTTTIDNAPKLAVGTEVEVFSSFHNGWVSGFEITAIENGRFALRRHTDWAVLPGTFPADDLRASRPKRA
jgi:hypothetical protein